MCVSSNDPDFIELEKLSKVLLLAGLIPSEQAIDNPAHCFEVHIARESEVLIGRCTKLDVPRGPSSLQGGWPRSLTEDPTGCAPRLAVFETRQSADAELFGVYGFEPYPTFRKPRKVGHLQGGPPAGAQLR
jgi:hypothetical protein